MCTSFFFNIRVRIVFYISSSVYFSSLCLAQKWIELSYKFSNRSSVSFFLFFSLPRLKLHRYLYLMKNIFYIFFFAIRFVCSLLNTFVTANYEYIRKYNWHNIGDQRVNSFLYLILTFPPIFHFQLSHFISNHRRHKKELSFKFSKVSNYSFFFFFLLNFFFKKFFRINNNIVIGIWPMNLNNEGKKKKNIFW